MSFLVSQNLQKYLECLVIRNQSAARRFGILYGFITSSDTIALMCTFCDETVFGNSEAQQLFLEQNYQLLPTGLDPIGLVDVSNSVKPDIEKITCLLDALRKGLQPHCKKDLVALTLQYNPSTSSELSDVSPVTTTGYRLKTSSPTAISDIPVLTKSSEALQAFYTCFHLNAQLDSALTPIHSKHDAGKALELKLLELQVQNKNDFAYGLQDNSLFLFPAVPSVVGPAMSSGRAFTISMTIKDCLAQLAKGKPKLTKQDGPKHVRVSLSDATGGLLPDEPVPLKLFYNATDGKSLHGSSPLLTIGQGSTHLIRFCLDTYLFLAKEKTLADLIEAVEIAKKRRLAGMVDFLRQSVPRPDDITGLPIPYHAINGPNILTLYSGSSGNNDACYQELYDRFGYDKSLPIFRKEASLRSRLLLAKRNLLNVGDRLVAHQILSKFLSEGTSWQLTKVPGAYTYHHYKQDRFDDDGWGCAYRSLQTLFSWFKLQGFTDAAIPNHEQIQRLLVEIKDREKSLIGSRQWIGATEIARTLEHLLQVQCRIINVPSGRDLGPALASLKSHFDSEGTPVMIGGGVYAYTIGGVAVNRTTGEVKALVVDPHFVGEDDMDLILKKNGVAWRTPDFWDQNAFYNLCCPLRPKLDQI